MSAAQTVLIVDDEAPIADLLDTILKGAGYRCLKANSGHEAVELVKRESPDLVILDINMPGMDGFQTCEMLRESPENCSLPIVMLTGRGDESTIVKALERGADGYIIKPFNQKELLHTLQQLLGKAKEGTLPSQYYFKNIKPKQEGASGESALS